MFQMRYKRQAGMGANVSSKIILGQQAKLILPLDVFAQSLVGG